jgi:hypothetical protein
MGATNINLGRQQVTVTPYQDLTSVNADQIISGIIRQGVYNSTVAIDSDVSNVYFNIAAGSTFVFERSWQDLAGTRNLVGKSVLGDIAEITISQATLSTYTSASGKLLLTADWDYNLNDQSSIYVNFTVDIGENLSNIIADGKLVVCSILGHNLFIGNNPTVYRIGYDSQYNRNVLNNLNTKSNTFQVFFHGTGAYVHIGLPSVALNGTNPVDVLTPTVAWVSDKLVYLPQTKIIAPPAILGTLGSAYQIDTLRFVPDETLGVEQSAGLNLVWYTTTKAAPGSPWTFSDRDSITQDALIAYLSGHRTEVIDSGHTILILVRDASCGVYMWPQWCYVLDSSVPQIGESRLSVRTKLPIYTEPTFTRI